MLAAIGSGLLLGAAFLFPQLSWMGWFALAPLFLCLRERDAKGNFLMGFLVGVPWFLVSCHWVRHVTWPGLFALAGIEGIWLGIWLALAGRFHARWRYLLLPTLWVAAEMTRSKGSLGFSWNLMGHLAPEALLPMVQVWGVYGLSFVIVAANAFIAATVYRLGPRAVWLRTPEGAGTFFALPVVWLLIGSLVLRWADIPTPDRLLRVGMVQGNFPQSLKWAVPVDEAVTRYVDLTSRLVKESRPDLVVWPEVAIPTVLSEQPKLLAYLQEWTEVWHTPLYFGVMDRDMREKGEDGPLYNSAVYLDPESQTQFEPTNEVRLASFFLRGAETGTPGSLILPSVVASTHSSEQIVYDKARLLQFGEYVPWSEWIPFVQRYVENRGGGAYSSGKVGRVIATKWGDLGTIVCSESTFSGLARRAVLNGAVLLVNMTNDAWYLKTAAARQHALQCRFRALETGRAVVRVANTGWTRVYLPDGSIHGSIPWWTTDAETVQAPLHSHLTFQTRVGDFLGWLCLVCVGLSLLISGEGTTDTTGESSKEATEGLTEEEEENPESP